MAFDTNGNGEVTFLEFCVGYSTLLRGTVPQLLEFAWRVFNVSGQLELQPADIFTVLKLGLQGVREIKEQQGAVPPGLEETHFPEREARQLCDEHCGRGSAPLSKRDFSRLILRCRRFVECLIPGFELIPQDPLHRAAESGEASECSHLLNVDGLEVDGQDALAFPTTPLHLAAQFGHRDACITLLDHGASLRLLSSDGDGALHIAARHGKEDVAQLFLQRHCDVVSQNALGQTALHLAAEYGHFRLARALVTGLGGQLVTDYGDHEGNTPLHSAALSDNFLALDAFLETADLDVNVRNRHGETPLVLAAVNGALRVARRLIELGADVAAVDGAGRSVLNAAVCKPGNQALISILLDSGKVNVNLPDDCGNTPLNNCIAVKDAGVLRALIKAGANTNVPEESHGYTPLHRVVLADWLEGLKILISQGNDPEIERDDSDCTPMDYARSPYISHLLRDYTRRRCPEWSLDYPVDMLFALVFYNGAWHVASSGDMRGRHVFKKAKVSTSVVAKRIKHGMMDMEGVVAQLEKAGLYTHIESVKIQTYFFGVFKGAMDDYSVVRVGAPLYRLQQEAERLRHQTKRSDSDRTEEYFINHDFYPETGFDEFTTSEKFKMCLNIIQGKSEEGTMSTGGGGQEQNGSSGISMAHYVKYQVLHSFIVLHDPLAQRELFRDWKLGGFMSAAYMKSQLLEYFFDSKNNRFRPLKGIQKYFGTKTAFVIGFESLYTNWLVAPAVAGAAAFGVSFVPSEYDSAIDDTDNPDPRFKEQYDHPIMYGYAFFLIIWSALLVKAWGKKQRELAHLWGVNKLENPVPTPNPESTAPSGLHLVDGEWQFQTLPKPSLKRRRKFITAFFTVPLFLVFFGCIGGYIYGLSVLSRFIDDQEQLHDFFQEPKEQRNLYGKLAIYGASGANGLIIWILNSLFCSLATKITQMEEQETLQGFDSSLGLKVLTFMFFNNYSSLFYFIFYERSVDKTAAALGSIMIVTQLMGNVSEFFFPWLSYRGRVKKHRSMVKPAAAKYFEDEEDQIVEEFSKGPMRQTETFSLARDELEREQETNAMDLAEMMIQFGYVALFGAVWPLAAAVAFANNFFEIRLDVWKFCAISRRPLSERVAGLPKVWMCLFEALAVMGVVSHCFMLGLSTNTMTDYFFPKISFWQRLLASFAAENFFVFLYAAIRLYGFNDVPKHVNHGKKEGLRFIRDAYRTGWALRETRMELGRGGKRPSAAAVARAQDVTTAAADRYLLLARYVDSLEPAERRRLLENSSLTISALVATIMQKKYGKDWEDPGELPTRAALLRQVVPLQNLQDAYRKGVAIREAAFWLWQRNAANVGAAPLAVTVITLRQLACIMEDCTMPQGKRYVRLVRHVEAQGGSPSQTLQNLELQYPGGLLDLLAALEGVADTGEPEPHQLGPRIEPVAEAQVAFEKSNTVRRQMYEHWVTDRHLRHDELVLRVAEELGASHYQIERYLLVRRYADSLDERSRRNLLGVAQARLLELVHEINERVDNGEWRDPGEPSFQQHVPPVVIDQE